MSRTTVGALWFAMVVGSLFVDMPSNTAYAQSIANANYGSVILRNGAFFDQWYVGHAGVIIDVLYGETPHAESRFIAQANGPSQLSSTVTFAGFLGGTGNSYYGHHRTTDPNWELPSFRHDLIDQALLALGKEYTAINLYTYSDSSLSNNTPYFGSGSIPHRFRCDGLAEWSTERALGLSGRPLSASLGFYTENSPLWVQPFDMLLNGVPDAAHGLKVSASGIASSSLPIELSMDDNFGDVTGARDCVVTASSDCRRQYSKGTYVQVSAPPLSVGGGIFNTWWGCTQANGGFLNENERSCTTFMHQNAHYTASFQTMPAPTASFDTHDNRVAISWGHVPGATTYQVFRCSSTSTGSCGSPIYTGAGGTGSVRSHNDFGASPGVTYHYRIKAGYSAGYANFSLSRQVRRDATRIIRLTGDLSFGNVTVGQSEQSTLTIHNDGNSALNVTSISYPSGFSGNWSGNIAAGGSRNVTVTFAPTAEQAYSGAVTVNSNRTSGTNTRSLSGTGVAAPTRVIRLAGDLSFGDVTVGQSSQRTLTVHNDGNSTLNVTSISYPSGFSGNWSGNIAAGSSRNVTVTFAPTVAQSYSGALIVNSDATAGTSSQAVLGTGLDVNVESPGVATLGASVIGTDVTLNASVNPNGAETEYWFEFGPSTSYGAVTSRRDAGSGTSAESVSAPVSDLECGVTYHFRVVASNSGGTSEGANRTFDTVPCAGPLTLQEALDNPELTWTTGGDAVWYPQTEVWYLGGSAAASGVISHNERSWIETTVAGPGSLVFRWRVSSERDADYLSLYINGVLQEQISGEVDWTYIAPYLPPGAQTLRWEYSKDGFGSQGADQGWLDWIIFTPSDCPHNVRHSVIHNYTAHQEAFLHACDTITVGPDVTVVAPDGNLILVAGERITFQPGVRVQAGGRLSARVDRSHGMELVGTATLAEYATAGAEMVIAESASGVPMTSAETSSANSREADRIGDGALSDTSSEGSDETGAAGEQLNDSAPSGLIATPGDGSVSLSWDELADSQGYHVYWSTAPGIHPFTAVSYDGFLGFVREDSVIVGDLANGTEYFFVVTAVRDGRESAASVEVSAKPEAGPVLIAGRYRLEAIDAPTVVDLETGLEWQRCALGQQWDGEGCVGTEARVTFAEARSVASEFNRQRVEESPWRVPEIGELQGLVYCTSGVPAYFPDGRENTGCWGSHGIPTLEPAVFPFASAAGGWFWSDSTHTDGQVWGLDFDRGIAHPYHGTAFSGLRLVRSVSQEEDQ